MMNSLHCWRAGAAASSRRRPGASRRLDDGGSRRAARPPGCAPRSHSKMAWCSSCTWAIHSARRASLPLVMRIASSRYCSMKLSSRTNCGLPVAAPMVRWNAKSSSTPSSPARVTASTVCSARRIAPSCARVARCAASAAISPSSTRRSSTTCTTASIDSSTLGSKASGRWRGWNDTNTPEPWRARTMPRDLTWCTASRTTERDTPCVAAICASLGRRSPGCRPPLSICWISRAANRSDRRSATNGSLASSRADGASTGSAMHVRLSDNFGAAGAGYPLGDSACARA